MPITARVLAAITYVKSNHLSESKHKAIVSALVAEKQAKKRTKSNHTLYLDTDNYLHLKEFCKAQGVTPSEVMDKLLKEFLDDAFTEGTITYIDTENKKAS
jgi:hypothetical protein